MLNMHSTALKSYLLVVPLRISAPASVLLPTPLQCNYALKQHSLRGSFMALEAHSDFTASFATAVENRVHMQAS